MLLFLLWPEIYSDVVLSSSCFCLAFWKPCPKPEVEQRMGQHDRRHGDIKDTQNLASSASSQKGPQQLSSWETNEGEAQCFGQPEMKGGWQPAAWDKGLCEGWLWEGTWGRIRKRVLKQTALAGSMGHFPVEITQTRVLVWENQCKHRTAELYQQHSIILYALRNMLEQL